jgi:hypothetical protein
MQSLFNVFNEEVGRFDRENTLAHLLQYLLPLIVNGSSELECQSMEQQYHRRILKFCYIKRNDFFSKSMNPTDRYFQSTILSSHHSSS